MEIDPAHRVASPAGQTILVLSSHTKPGLSAPINHRIYSQRHGYDYLFDATPYPISSPYDQKTYAVLAAMKRTKADWIFWIDDDGYFMDHSIPLARFLPADPNVDFIFCRSPVNPKGQWTVINAGIYFVRNSASARALLEELLVTDMRVVEKWWNEKEHGMFIPDGDQERFVYLFLSRGMVGTKVIILDYTAFNARPYHFKSRYDEHFICHLASHRDKAIPLNDMRTRFGLDRYLMPEKSDAYTDTVFRYSVFASDPPVPPQASLWARAKRRLRKAIKGGLRLSHT